MTEQTKSSRLEEPVTWKGVLILLGSAVGTVLVVIALLAQGVISRSEAASERARVDAKAVVTSKADASEVALLRVEVGAARSETFENRKDTQAVYRFMVTRERQERLEQPLSPPAPIARDGGP